MCKIERYKKWIKFSFPHEACRCVGKMGKVKRFDKSWQHKLLQPEAEVTNLLVACVGFLFCIA